MNQISVPTGLAIFLQRAERGGNSFSLPDWAFTCLKLIVMHRFRLAKANMLTFALLLPSLAGTGYAQSTDPQPKPDNAAVNKRDQNPGEATAHQQKMNAADRDNAAKIRRSVIADKSLPTYAYNVKIISQNGTITLKGPVRSDEEVRSIVSKATDVIGRPDKVINQMSVKPASKP
jgi:hyperosmotically inducible periplasmic protein